MLSLCFLWTLDWLFFYLVNHDTLMHIRSLLTDDVEGRGGDGRKRGS